MRPCPHCGRWYKPDTRRTTCRYCSGPVPPKILNKPGRARGIGAEYELGFEHAYQGTPRQRFTGAYEAGYLDGLDGSKLRAEYFIRKSTPAWHPGMCHAPVPGGCRGPRRFKSGGATGRAGRSLLCAAHERKRGRGGDISEPISRRRTPPTAPGVENAYDARRCRVMW